MPVLSQDTDHESSVLFGELPLVTGIESPLGTDLYAITELIQSLGADNLETSQAELLTTLCNQAQSCEQVIGLVNTSLFVISQVDASPAASNLLNKSVEILQGIDEPLGDEITENLIKILVNSLYTTTRETICLLIINSNKVLSVDEIDGIPELLKEKDSLCVLDLLINKDLLDEKIASGIIDPIKNVSVGKPIHILCQKQLLHIIDHFATCPELLEIFTPFILELFQSQTGSTFLKQIFRSISDPELIASINTSMLAPFQGVCQLLDVESIYSKIMLNGDMDDSDVSKLSDLFSSKTITVTRRGHVLSGPYFKSENADVTYQGHSDGECYIALLAAQKGVARILEYQGNVGPALIEEYENYLIKFLHNPLVVNSNSYNILLNHNINCYIHLLRNGQSLSTDTTDFLIDVLSERSTIPRITGQYIVVLLSSLMEKNHWPEEAAESTMRLIKSCSHIADRMISRNISNICGYLAAHDIIDDEFTEELCEKHLNIHSASQQILNSIECIVSHTGALQTGAVKSLVRFAENIDNPVNLRLEVVNILGKIPSSISEEEITTIADLLKGDITTNRTWHDAVDVESGEITLGYQKLEFLAHQNDLQIAGRPEGGNALFSSIANSLLKIGSNKSANDLYSAVRVQLNSFPKKYTDISIEEFDRAIGGGLLLNDLMLQAVADAIEIDINVYSYDGNKSTKISETCSNDLSINIGATDTRYWSLVPSLDKASISSNDNISTRASNTEEIDFRVANAVTGLLATYANHHNKLSEPAALALQSALGNKEMFESALDATTSMVTHNPGIFGYEKFLKLQEDHPAVASRLAAQASLERTREALDAMNMAQDDNPSDILGASNALLTEINQLSQLLEENRLDNPNPLYELLTNILASSPDLLSACMGIIQLVPPTEYFTPEQKQIIDQLVVTDGVKYEDLSWLAVNDCYSEDLQQSIEQYLVANFQLISENKELLADIITTFKALSIDGSGLSAGSLYLLAQLAVFTPEQALNIVKIIQLNTGQLTNNEFVALESLFTNTDKTILTALGNVFIGCDQHLTSNFAINTIFTHITDGYLSKPESKVCIKLLTDFDHIEAKYLLKLLSDTGSDEKIAVLIKLQEAPLRAQLIPVILSLLKISSLTTACIKFLANFSDSIAYLLHERNIDLDSSEIIYAYKDDLVDEYAKLEQMLTINQAYFAKNQQHTKIHAALEKKFPTEHITNHSIAQIADALKYYDHNQQFIDEFILDVVLDKASSFVEYRFFVEFINKHHISIPDITQYLQDNDLISTVMIFETNLLIKDLDNLKLDAEPALLHSFKQHCYQLKSAGWSLSGLEFILNQVTSDNLLYIASTLNALIKYGIKEEERNKDGNCFIDIFKNSLSDPSWADKEFDQSIHSIFINKFEHKLENKGIGLIEKISDLNPDFAASCPDYHATLEQIHDWYQNGAEGNSSINRWSAEQVLEWAIKFKASNGQTNSIPEVESSKLEDTLLRDPNIGQEENLNIAKIIAVLQRANNLHTATNYKDGHLFRDTQIISLLFLLDKALDLNTGPNDKGRLLQIATGEGKSAISAALAATLALLGESVDIITSSSVLASTGYKNAKGFFKILGLSTGLNTNKSDGNGGVIYTYDIVYGNTITFQSDFLSNSSKQGIERGDRDFSFVIIDEVDSMLLDGSNVTARQATALPLMEYLLPVMTSAWNVFSQMTLPDGMNHEVAVDIAQRIIDEKIDALLIPVHLVEYAKNQASKWAGSLINAAWVQELDKDYVINTGINGKKIINPVNISTGVTQENMVWQNGLHQFLQIKHNLHITPEGLTTFFISNISYFLKYNKILGLTGTLGSETSKDFLRSTYHTDLAFMPTYKDKQVVELEPQIATTVVEHREAIYASAYREACEHKRATLIVCKSIQEVDDCCSTLKARYGNDIKVVNYSRSEAKLYNLDIEHVLQPGTIIVATSLAGRGTDIITSKIVESNGGLHVISTFIGKNARDESQIQGRTARQGNSGTHQEIILDRGYYDDNIFSSGANAVINVAKATRDAAELHDLQEAIKTRIPKIIERDELYSKFSDYYIELSERPEAIRSGAPKIKQLIEDFGLWIKFYKDGDSIEAFIDQARVKYDNATYTNPVYPTTQSYGMDDPVSAIKLLQSAIDINDVYNLAAHYYSAKAFLDGGDDHYSDYKDRAISSLMEAANRTTQLIHYLTAMNISVAGDIGPDNELLQQTTAKLGFFHSFLESMQKAVDVIAGCASDKEVRIKSCVSQKVLNPSLDDDDVTEIGFVGVNYIFEVEAYRPRQDWTDTILVGVCAIAQIAVGILIAIGTIGSGMSLAISVFSEGLKDAYDVIQAASKGKAIDLDEYLTGKAISYALIGATAGIDKLSAGNNVAKVGAEEGAKQGGKEVVSKSAIKAQIASSAATKSASGMTENAVKIALIKEMAKGAGVQLAQTIAVQHIAEWASNEVRDNVLDGLEERISHAVEKTTHTALSNNPTLLTNDNNIERHNLLKEVQNEVYYATKAHKHLRIINELASGLFKASAKHHSIGAALYAAHKISGIVDVGSKIEPIMHDLQEKITNIINRAGEKTAQRNKGYVPQNNQGDPAQQEETKNHLCKNIGDIVAKNLLNQIQRKITTPLISSAVTTVTDKALEDYRAESHAKMAAYSNDLQAKRMQASIATDEAASSIVIGTNSLQAQKSAVIGQGESQVTTKPEGKDTSSKPPMGASGNPDTVSAYHMLRSLGLTERNLLLENSDIGMARGGVNDFYAPTPSSLAASNQNEYNPYVSRYSDGVLGNTDPVPLYDVAKQYKTGGGQYTDSRVKQGGGYLFSGGTSPASNEASLFSGIDFSPEQNSSTDRIAGTDFYGRPAPSFSVTRDNNSQSTFGYVVSELFGIQSAEAAVPFVIGAGAAEALTYSAGALGLGTAWWSLNNAATGAGEYQSTRSYSRDDDLYARQGGYQPALTGNLMIGGMNTGLFANPIDQMRFDGTIPEVDEQTPRTNIVANKGRAKLVTETETSVLLKQSDSLFKRGSILAQSQWPQEDVVKLYEEIRGPSANRSVLFMDQDSDAGLIFPSDDTNLSILYRKRDAVESTKNPSNVPIIISAPMPPDPGDDDELGQCEQGVSILERQAQSKFKHAEDFGILGNYNKVSGQEFLDALKDFITSDSVYKEEIFYRGEKRCIYIDKKTDRGVLTKDGQFESGWKLTENQLEDVLLRGRLS